MNLIFVHRSMPAVFSMIPSSQLDVVGEHINSSNDERELHHQSTLGHTPSDQDSTTSILQSFLAFISQHRHHGEVNNAYMDIICICIEKILTKYQSEATTVEDCPSDSNTGWSELREIQRENHRPLPYPMCLMLFIR